MTDENQSDRYHVFARAVLADDRVLVLKNEDSFGVFDRRGDVHGHRHDLGIFYRGMRYVSSHELRIGPGEKPLLLNSDVSLQAGILIADLTNPDIQTDDQTLIHKGALHFRREKFLLDRWCYETLTIENLSNESILLPVSLSWAADFKDIFEVRGSVRAGSGQLLEPRIINENRILLSYKGLDQVVRFSSINCYPSPSEMNSGEIVFRMGVPPRGTQTLNFQIEFSEGGVPNSNIKVNEARLRFDAVESHKRNFFAEIQADNETVNEWLYRSECDLVMLTSDLPSGFFPYAGIPWYSTPFGRDSLITSLQTLWLNPMLARGVLAFLAQTQARDESQQRDSEPGKIIHEMRRGEMANTNEIPFGQYYGSVDSTPLFLILACAYFERTADMEFIETIWPQIEFALTWLLEWADQDRDGFVEYAAKSVDGLSQQGWKDSSDAIFHADGDIAESPIALCEVQAYAFAALHSMGYLIAFMGDAERSVHLHARAEELKRRFQACFWDLDLGVYVLALDRKKRACRVVTSNAGQCLFSGIANYQQARSIARILMQPHMFSGWGIRTVSELAARYNPLSYHNGSVWPHDNSLIAWGFDRYGFKNEVKQIFEGQFAAARASTLKRLPELFCGFARQDERAPVLYPVACSPQAWASGSVYLLIQALLGLIINAPARSVRFCRPVLPTAIRQLRIRNLQVQDAFLDLEVTTHEDDVSVQILQRVGEVELLVEK